MPKTIILDFDGVLHGYESGWQGPRKIPDPPVSGAIDFLLELLVDEWDIAIHSSRSHQFGGRRAMKKWLHHHAALDYQHKHFYGVVEGLWNDLHAWWRAGFQPGMGDPIEEEPQDAANWLVKQIHWPKHKPPAIVQLDDRAMTFTGEFPSLNTLNNFKPWNR